MTYIPGPLRQLVEERAAGRCEYCLFRRHENTFLAYEVEHIYAQKHAGETIESNLCLSCYDCNRYKGSDLCSLDPVSGEIVILFHPRPHEWSEHFRLADAQIEPLTPQGRVTVRLLHLNDDARVEERTRLIHIGHYP